RLRIRASRRVCWPAVPAADHGQASLGRAVGDAARVPPLARAPGRLEGEVAEQRAQHHVQLRVREGRADAAPDAAAEWDPLVGIRPLVQETIRVEAVSLGEERLVIM